MLIIIYNILYNLNFKIGRGETKNFEDMFAGTSSSASAWAIAIYSGTELLNDNGRNENLTPRLSEFEILFLGFLQTSFILIVL